MDLRFISSNIVATDIPAVFPKSSVTLKGYSFLKMKVEMVLPWAGKDPIAFRGAIYPGNIVWYEC